MKISKKAFNIYLLAANTYKNDSQNVLIHMALIQSFEVVFEIAWKVLKDYLKENGIKKQFPKEIIKEAFATEILKNGEIWIDMLNDRNASDHEYNLDKMNTVLERISTTYFNELKSFADWVSNV